MNKKLIKARILVTGTMEIDFLVDDQDTTPLWHTAEQYARQELFNTDQLANLDFHIIQYDYVTQDDEESS